MKIKRISVLVWGIVAVLFFANIAVSEYFDPLTEDSKAEDISVQNENVSITVTAVGDCTLGTDVNFAGSGSFVNEVKQKDEDYSYFFDKVDKYFRKDDLTIVNFEGTLSERGQRENKQFAFRGDPDYVSILSKSGIEAANLANNHTKDYGSAAYNDTKKILSENGIVDFGLEDISITEVKGIRIGLIGINALNDKSRNSYPALMKKLNKLNPDLIIANFHWGSERAATPNYLQTQLAHDAIDNGADLVIGHHPHVIQGIEEYKNKYIIYSLGNFCFGGNTNPSDKDTMIFRQTFNFKKGKLLTDDEVSIIPCSISSTSSRNNYQPTPLTGSEYTRVKAKIEKRSSAFDGIENIKFIRES